MTKSSNTVSVERDEAPFSREGRRTRNEGSGSTQSDETELCLRPSASVRWFGASAGKSWDRPSNDRFSAFRTRSRIHGARMSLEPQHPQIRRSPLSWTMTRYLHR